MTDGRMACQANRRGSPPSHVVCLPTPPRLYSVPYLRGRLSGDHTPRDHLKGGSNWTNVFYLQYFIYNILFKITVCWFKIMIYKVVTGLLLLLNTALCRIKLLPVTHVMVDMWMLTIKPVHKL